MKYTINFAVIKKCGIKRLGLKWLKIQAKTAEVCEGCYLTYKYLNYCLNNDRIKETQPVFAMDSINTITEYCSKVKDEKKRSRLLKVRQLIMNGLLGHGNSVITGEMPHIGAFNYVQWYSHNPAIKNVTSYVEFKSGVNPFKKYNKEWFEILNILFSKYINSQEAPMTLKVQYVMSTISNYLPTIENKNIDAITRLEIDSVYPGNEYKPTPLERRNNPELDINKYRSVNIHLMNFILAFQYAVDHYEKHNNTDHEIFKYFNNFNELLSAPKHSIGKYKFDKVDWEAVCLEFNLYNVYIDSVWELAGMERQYTRYTPPELKTTTIVDKWMINYFNESEQVAMYSDIYKRSKIFTD